MNTRDSDRYDSFSRRTTILSGGALGLIGTLLGRFYHIQVLESDKYKTLAEDNAVNVQLLAPCRGKIFDRFGAELASNRDNYLVLLTPAETRNLNKALDDLSKIIPLSESQRTKVIKTASRQTRYSAIIVAENLTWEQFARVNVNRPDLGSIRADIGIMRNYPYSSESAHVVGYLAAANKDESRERPGLALPDLRVGKTGIEKSLEIELRGNAGRRHVEVNAHGKIIRELERFEGDPGEDIVLTLDIELQSFTAKRLKGQSGAAVVMDIHDGDVLALVSVPSFDPNSFYLGLSPDAWEELRNDEYNPLLNKAIAGQYPPGSTFKMIVAMAALEAGIISPKETIFCSGRTTLGDRDFHCWKKGGHGALSMQHAIKYSCDSYFYEIAKRTGIDRIETMAKRFGLGQHVDIEIPGEKPGLVPSRSWKISNIGEPWQQGETLITGIGQGYLLTTPLQLAVMVSRLANGGKSVKPRLVRSVGKDASSVEETVDLGLPSQHLKLIHQGMYAVSNELGGTAYGSGVRNPGMRLAGKTGTSQVQRITRAERAGEIIRNEDLSWNRRDHSLFVAFAPVQSPRYAISVLIEHGGDGSRAAAPAAKDIMYEALKRDPLRRRSIGPIASQSTSTTVCKRKG